MPSRNPSPKIPKTKTFGGCWTCRRRKVKCDNTRPKCNRCSKDFQCEGYDITLFWMPSGYIDEPDPSLKGRKAMLLHDERIPTSCNVSHVHEMLVTLDEAEKESALSVDYGVGPFSVFPVSRPSTASQKDISRDSFTDTEDAPEACVPNEDSDDSVPITLDEENYFDMNPEVTVGSLEDDLEIVAQTPGFDQTGSTVSSLLDLEFRTRFFSNRATRELMHNYITTVADLLQPASHYQNPYKSIYVPNALIGSADSLDGVGMLEQSHSNVAVFHAILSVSAFHLRGTDASPDRVVFDKLGRLHRGRAFEHLQKALLDELERSDHQAVMSAMMSLVSSDLMDGGMTEFWIHLDGCERLQRLIPDSQILQEPYKQLHSVCSFMATIARSTQQNIPSFPWPDLETSEDVQAYIPSPFYLDDHSLEFTYGITASLASFIHTTTKLYQNVLYYTTNELPFPDSLKFAINSHGRNIADWSLAKESFSSIHPIDHDTLAIIRHHAMAFHRAICIHFHTLLLPTTHTILTTYSQTTVENLIAAESLKRTHGARYGWKSMAPVVWPGFIASCQADVSDRDLWRSWWMMVQKYRIGSITRLWGVVREVWNSRDNGCVEIPGWAPILRAKGLRVISGG